MARPRSISRKPANHGSRAWHPSSVNGIFRDKAMALTRLLCGSITLAAMGWSLTVLAADKPDVKPRPDSLTVRTTVNRTATAPGMRRTDTRRVGRSQNVEALGDANAWFVVEAAVADFGEMLPEQRRELTEAFVIRVHSDRDWELRLVPHADLQVMGTAGRVPLDRLAWSSPESPGFEVFTSLAPVTVGPRAARPEASGPRYPSLSGSSCMATTRLGGTAQIFGRCSRCAESAFFRARPRIYSQPVHQNASGSG